MLLSLPLFINGFPLHTKKEGDSACQKKTSRFLSLCIAILLLLGVVPVQAADVPISSEPVSSEAFVPVTGESSDILASRAPSVSSASSVTSMATSSFEATDRLTIPDGVYAFKNLGNANRWMDVERNSTSPGAHIQQYAYTKSPAEVYSASGLFRISRVAGTSNRFIFRLMLNEALTFGISGGEIITKTIPANDADVSPSDTFIILLDNGGYTIKPYGSSYCIAANNTTASGMAGAPDSFLVPRTSSSAGNCARWLIEGYQTVVPDGVYAFLNMGNTSRWMDTALDLTTPGAHMQQYAFGSSPAGSFSRSGLFKVARVGTTNRYVIRLMLNNSLTFGFSGNSVFTKTIPTDDALVSTTDTFTIEYNNGGYIIKPYGSSYCIAANSTSASGSAGAPDSYLVRKSIDSIGNSSRWTLERYTGIDIYGYSLLFSSGDSSLSTGEQVDITPIVWSTYIGISTPYMEIISADKEIAESVWNSSSGKANVTTHLPGVAHIVVQIRKGSLSQATLSLSGQLTVTAPFSEGIYSIRNIDMNLFMQIDNDTSPNYGTSGAVMEQYEFDGGDYQRWKFLHEKDGYYKIVSVKSGMALSVASANVNKDAEALTQESYKELDRQLWKITKSSRGNYIFRPKSGKAYSSDWCMSSGSGFIVQNGRDVEQRPYTDDSNLKDEWEIIKRNDLSLLALPEKYDRTTFFSKTKEVMSKIGYTDSYDNRNTVEEGILKSQLLCRMANSKITVVRTHGEPTYIAVSDGYFTRDDLLKQSNSLLEYAELIIYGACLTGLGKESSNNLVNATREKGCRIVIGFEKSVYVDELNKWIEIFFDSLAKGKTVEQSCLDADNYIKNDFYHVLSDENNLVTTDSWYIAGEKTTVFSLSPDSTEP